jgi:L-fucose isomerase-like protein
MSLTPNDLRPERTMDVVETIERLRGREYADRVRFAINMVQLARQCQESVISGSRLTACVTSSLLVALLDEQMPKVLGVSQGDITAALGAAASDKRDIAAKLQQEFGT